MSLALHVCLLAAKFNVHVQVDWDFVGPYAFVRRNIRTAPFRYEGNNL